MKGKYSPKQVSVDCYEYNADLLTLCIVESFHHVLFQALQLHLTLIIRNVANSSKERHKLHLRERMLSDRCDNTSTIVIHY